MKTALVPILRSYVIIASRNVNQTTYRTGHKVLLRESPCGMKPEVLFRYIIKITLHSSFEIEDFVETHICKLCVILRSRVLLGVCPH